MGTILAVANPGGVVIGQAAIGGKRRPDGFAVARSLKRSLIADFDARRFKRSDGELAVELLRLGSASQAIEDDALYRS